MKTIRVRLSGNQNFRVKTLHCDICGASIIENHEAVTPIYYVEEKEPNTIFCVTCNHNLN